MSHLSLAESLRLNRPGVYVVEGVAPEHVIDALHMPEDEIQEMATHAPQLFKARLGTYEESFLPPTNCSKLGEWSS